MSSDNRRRYWLEPNVEWDHSDVTALKVRLGDWNSYAHLLTVIREGRACWGEIQWISFKGSSCGGGGLFQNEPTSTVYLHGIYRLTSDEDHPIVILVDESRPDTVWGLDHELKSLVAELCSEFSLGKFSMTQEEAERGSDIAALINHHQHMQEQDRDVLVERFNDEVLDALQKAVWVSPLEAGEEDSQIQEKIGGPDGPGSRDGKYQAKKIRGVHSEKIRGGTRQVPGALVVSWSSSNNEMAGFPELKAALEGELPSAFCEPRSESVTPPEFKEVVILDDTRHIALPRPGDPWPSFPLVEDPSEISETKKLWEKLGPDALGWYASFHLHTEEVWGIYLNEERLLKLAGSWVLDDRGKSGMAREEILELLVWMVYWHEMFHAKVEAVLTGLELVSHNKKYLPYKNGVYDKARNKKCWREEALANWDAMRLVKEHFGEQKFEFLKPWLLSSPRGYRHWEEGEKVWTWRMFATELVEGIPFPDEGRKRPLPLEGLLRERAGYELLREDIPLRLAGKGQLADELFSQPSRKEAVKALKNRGYRLKAGGKGSHEKWEGDCGVFTLPRTNPLSPPVFKNLLKCFSINKKEYLQGRSAL